jgi:hypothetical protein
VAPPDIHIFLHPCCEVGALHPGAGIKMLATKNRTSSSKELIRELILQILHHLRKLLGFVQQTRLDVDVYTTY